MCLSASISSEPRRSWLLRFHGGCKRTEEAHANEAFPTEGKGACRHLLASRHSSTALRYRSWKQLLLFTQQAHNSFYSLAALTKALMMSDQSHSASTLGLSPEMCRIHKNHIEKLRRLYHIHWLKGPGSPRALAQGPWATSDSLGLLPQQSWLINLL